MLLAIDLHENFIDVESVTVAAMLSLQPSCKNSTKLDALETDRFSGDSDASLSEEILYITVTEAESIVQPDGVADYVRWKAVTFVCIHGPILAIQ